jgi:hypothetical protein
MSRRALTAVVIAFVVAIGAAAMLRIWRRAHDQSAIQSVLERAGRVTWTEMASIRRQLLEGRPTAGLLPSDLGTGIPRSYQLSPVAPPVPKHWVEGVLFARAVETDGPATACLVLYPNEIRITIAEESGTFLVLFSPEAPPQYSNLSNNQTCSVSTGDADGQDPQQLQRSELRAEAALDLDASSRASRRLAIAVAVDYDLRKQYNGNDYRLKTDLAAMLSCTNTILKRDLRVELFMKEDSLFFPPEGTLGNGSALADDVQRYLRKELTSPHDLGHLLATIGGGWAQQRGVCAPSAFAQAYSTTNFPIPSFNDIFVHEIGHQLGAYHSFNAATGGRHETGAYEPDRGRSLMTHQRLAPPYFHASSARFVRRVLTNGLFGSSPACGAPYPGPHNSINVKVPARDWLVPPRTPFELEAIADPDVLYYRWDEFEQGQDAGSEPPTFPSSGDNARTRVFPPFEWLFNWNYQLHAWPSPGSDTRFMVIGRSKHDVMDDESVRVHTTKSPPFVLTKFNCQPPCKPGTSGLELSWNSTSIEGAPFRVRSLTAFVFDEQSPHLRTQIQSFANNGSTVLPLPVGIKSTTSARVAVKADKQIFFALSPRFTIG